MATRDSGQNAKPMVTNHRSGKLFRRAAGCALLVLVSFVAYAAIRAEGNKEETIGVGLTGVHHLGSNYNIADFYVNGYSGMNVGRGGGGGSTVCCVIIPMKWREGLMVDVRWTINDWSQENRKEIEAGNYESMKYGGAYRAIVPVERYEEPGRIFVHFFPNGRVRVVSSNIGAGGPQHPIQRHDPRAAELATKGVAVDWIFTNEELAEMERKSKEHRAKFGDWR